MKRHLYLWLVLLFAENVRGQPGLKDSCTAFTLRVSVDHAVSDTMIIGYTDCDLKFSRSSKVYILNNGEVTVTGKINRATEVELDNNTKSKLIGGPEVLRFIMEPGDMTVHLNMVGDTAKEISSTGSYAQQEKERWDRGMASLFRSRDSAFNSLVDVLQHKEDSLEFNRRFPIVSDKYNTIRHAIVLEVLKYVKVHHTSYFSGYLLDRYRRLMPVDTLGAYLTYLDQNVVSSDFGLETLKELLPNTDDSTFRKRFMDTTAYRLFREIGSVYDLSLTDSSGKKTQFSSFRGYILLIDFWGSWCGPCIKNIPYLKKLIEDMNGKPVRIVSVSMDDRRDVWEKSLRRYGFPGLQLLDDHKLLSILYKVLWVPRYILINPDGSVENMDAPQAMEPQLRVELDKMIERYRDSKK